MRSICKIIVGLIAAVPLAAVTLPISARAEQLKKIAILPKTLVNDVFRSGLSKQQNAKPGSTGSPPKASRLEAMRLSRIKLISSRL